MATKQPETKDGIYIVVPRNNETLKEKAVMTGFGKRSVPFNRPVRLNAQEYKNIQRQKEPIQIEKEINVMEIMEEHQISQTKANEMAKLKSSNTKIGGKQISFVPKFFLQRT